MPAKSKSQYKLMAMIAHGGKPKAKGIGCIPSHVAREFIHKTPKRKRTMFSKGK